MTKLISMAAVAATLVAAPSAALAQKAPGAVVIVVDTERVYRDCNACKTAGGQMQSQLRAAQTRETTLNSQLQTEGAAIQKLIDALGDKQPDAALQARVKAFETKRTTGGQELQRLQTNLQSTQANVLRQINAKLGPVYSQVMSAKGANVAVDVSATLATGATLDATNDVLAALNAALPSISVTPMPASATPAK